MLLRRELLFGAGALVLARGGSALQTAPSQESQTRRVRPPPWGPPYTRQELRDAERRFGVRFPPDLFEFLLQRRFARSPDWAKDEAAISELLAWPLDGILHDIERNDVWAPHWGPRPTSLEARIATAERLVNAAPKLIPLGPNHYIPETPFERGNPIFFVFLSDVRYYEANLADYFERVSAPRQLRRPVTGIRKPIPFWTEMSMLQTRPPKLRPKAPTQPGSDKI